MKVIGVVDWTSRDKNGTPIAGVVPLVEDRKGEWRTIDATEEFPSQGQAFWFAAHTAAAKALVRFRAKPNPGQKDEYQVDGPEVLFEVIDLSALGYPPDVRTALASGSARVPGPVGSVRVFVLCKSDLLVGPVDLTRANDGTLKLTASAYPRVPVYNGAHIRALPTTEDVQRLIRVDKGPPSAYVDWDDDVTILRRAIDVSAKMAKQAGRDVAQTKKQLEDAASALASTGLGLEATLNHYRLERALALTRSTDIVARAGDELITVLRTHPAIEAAIDAHKQHMAKEVEQQVRDQLTQTLADKLNELKALTDSVNAKSTELEEIETRLREMDAAVDSRVRAALARPADILGQVSVFRPLLTSAGVRDVETGTARPKPVSFVSSRPAESIRDAPSLRRILTSTARSRGVEPALMLRLHAATVAGLLPVTLGSRALAALIAYADGVCGGRMSILHVPPSAIHPNDFDVLPVDDIRATADSAQDFGSISLVILEGANRAPLEASLIPILQLTEVGLSTLASVSRLRLAASFVSGATTAPVTPQLWSHAVAIWPEAIGPVESSSVHGIVPLQSELFAAGDEPTDVIDTLLDAWPDARDLRPALSRFGSALTRLYNQSERVTEALLDCVILPYIATAFTLEEQAQALSRAGDEDGSNARVLKRLRTNLS